jgi:hypothetical protein
LFKAESFHFIMYFYDNAWVLNLFFGTMYAHLVRLSGYDMAITNRFPLQKTHIGNTIFSNNAIVNHIERTTARSSIQRLLHFLYRVQNFPFPPYSSSPGLYSPLRAMMFKYDNEKLAEMDSDGGHKAAEYTKCIATSTASFRVGP